MSYIDNTGVLVKIGTEVAVPLTGGEYRNYGELREIEVKVDLTKLTTTLGGTIINDQIFFPKNMIVQEVELFVNTAATGATATLDLGLINVDRTTENDFNGFIAALAGNTTPLTSLGQKTVISKGVTGAGAFIGGSAIAASGYLCANVNTAVFTTGVVTFRIRYFRP